MKQLFWEYGAPFGLISLKLMFVVVVLAMLCILALLYRGWWADQDRVAQPIGRYQSVSTERRGAKLGGTVLNLALYTGAVILPAIALLLALNRGENFYVSFAEVAAQITNIG